MDEAKSKDIVLICGNHTNAHTIVRNLPVIGFEGETIIIRNYNDPVLVADRLNPKVKKWVLSASEAENLPEAIAKRWGDKGFNIYVCFTSERYHRSFAKWKQEHPNDNIIVKFGDFNCVSAVLDRFELYQFIKERNLAAIPKTIPVTEDPFKILGDKFVVRPRESWQSPTQRECVKIVQGKQEYEKIISDFAFRGVGAEKLCLQELLCIKNESNVSICGWFDMKNRHLYCLRKRLQHPPGVGTGDVCELIEPPKGIMGSAVAILTELKYVGPLELEFVFDANSNEYKVIEINPRFWMQHGLVELISGRALLSRYLGKEPLVINRQDAQKKYWLNTAQCLYRALKFNFKPLIYYYRKDSWAPYSLFDAMWYAPLHVFSKIISRE